MSNDPVLWTVDPRGVATVTLNRPAVGNAYDAGLIGGLIAAMDAIEGSSGVRAILLRGNGRHFQAGADLNWIKAVSAGSADDNKEASRATARAVDRLNHQPVPTVALVQGGCFGGGTGLVAACDVVVAADNAVFSIAEVRWGLTAAIIMPQLSDAISVRQLRRYGLTGERFGAAEVHAFDLDPDMVRRARARLAPYLEAGRLRLEVGDASAIPAESASYDAVFDFGILHHVPDWRAAVAEVARVLRPGGVFFFEEVTRQALDRWVFRTFFEHPTEDRFGREDLSGRGLAVPVEHFHDLPLPPREVGERFLFFHAAGPPSASVRIVVLKI